MKRKGFTLIELLAVIVILAIIALIATPIVMNTIEKSKKGAVERSAENYIEAVDTMIATHKLETGEMLPDGPYSVDSDGNLTDGTNTYTIEVNGTKPKSGSSVKIENRRAVNNGTSLKYDPYTVVYDINVGKLVATIKTISKVWSYDDSNSNESIDIGDLITVGTESFYVISNDGTNIKALAQYNLNVSSPYGGVATGLQNENVVGCREFSNSGDCYGYVKFDNDSNVYEGSEIENYVNEYKTKLEMLGATIDNASLITVDELRELDSSSPFTGLYFTSYWTKSSKDTSDVYVMSSRYSDDDYEMFLHYGATYRGGTIKSYSFNYFDGNGIWQYGVRPVITISVDEL